MTIHKKWLVRGVLLLAGATYALAQTKTPQINAEHSHHEHKAPIAQIVALDECDPTSFNAVLGPDFCKNVAIATLKFATTFGDLFKLAAAGTPDPGWDFEPDVLTVKEGTTLVATNQGGEPHTFTEVKQFGGGFIKDLNAGEPVVSECDGGFKSVDVAKTRIIQGSSLNVTDLPKGEHHFQCCIHPWMRMTVEVK